MEQVKTYRQMAIEEAVFRAVISGRVKIEEVEVFSETQEFKNKVDEIENLFKNLEKSMLGE